MSVELPGWIKDTWYMAMPGHLMKPGKTQHKTLLGEPLLIGRDAKGDVFAMRDVCPHRAVPLSEGWFDGETVQCCYHGWRFNCKGTCVEIPSLPTSSKLDPSRINVKSYPCREVQGNIWVYMARDDVEVTTDNLPDIVELPGVTAEHVGVHVTQRFECAIDHAVIGLMDPAHGPFVHQNWWWRTPKHIREKSKKFAPSHLGFTMVKHSPSSNSKAYKILGGEIATEIRFQLPGIRVEHIQSPKVTVCGLTTVVPITEKETEVTQMFYWTKPWFNLLKPVAKRFIHHFLGQDRDVVHKQQKGLKHDPNLMLINDADVMAKWYYQLKKAYFLSQEEGKAFENPVKETTLTWCS